MDTPNQSESNSPLDTNQAASLFAEMLDPEREEKDPVEAEAEEPEAEVEAEAEESEPEDDAETEQPTTVTIKIDGKDVEVTLDELKKGYQRQADYTRKTMEVSAERKAAEAEANKAREERNQYSTKLQEQGALLSALMQEQTQIDWQQLLDSDPVEYLKQQHLYQQRQAALQNIQREQQNVYQLQQQEQAKYVHNFIAQQQQELLAKLPDWKDETKAKAEKSAIKNYLSETGFSAEEIDSLSDHRSVLVARKAMLYDQMIGKAKAAAKKVQNVPQRVERSSTGQSQSLDKRGQAFQRLTKSGRVEDAAAVFASLL